MLRRTLGHLLVFFLYTLAMSIALLVVAPPYGLLLNLLLYAAVLRFYLLRAHRADAPRRWATLRLRPLAPAVLPWMLAFVPVVLLLSWALGELYLQVVPVPPETLNPFGPLLRDRWGRFSVTVLAIGIAPVVEEFFFRGLIQRPLERRYGAAAGITGAAALFALIHLLPWVLPLHFFLGLVFGWAVYVTRSIWAGTLLHAANNAAAVLGLQGIEDPLTRPTVWETGLHAEWWNALLTFALAAAAALWVGRRLRRAAARAH